MADPVVCDEIVAALQCQGQPVVVYSNDEFRQVLGLTHRSNTQVKQALGSLIERHVVTRSRPRPEGITGGAPPITLRLHAV